MKAAHSHGYSFLSVLKAGMRDCHNEQLQFFSLAYNAAKLSEKPLSVITVVKDLPIAILKMFLHGKKPFSAMLPTIKHGINNIDTAVGTSYQFSLSKNLK